MGERLKVKGEGLKVKGDGVRFFTTDYTDFHGLYLYSIRME